MRGKLEDMNDLNLVIRLIEDASVGEDRESRREQKHG
jgi:hypothetical protein